MTVDYVLSEVPVDGGSLAIGRWGRGDRIVLASHGITANHLSWQTVARHLVEGSDGEVSLVAIDHRGRARSADAPGPYGMDRHADDLMLVADHLGRDEATLTGHSMGGFVVATAAERHSDRVPSLVMIDGGLPLPLELPADVDVEQVIQAVIGPALDRLDQRWATVDDYVDFFVQHPAFQPPNEFPPAADAYVRYDAVVGADGQVRSSVVKEAVLVDGGAAVADPDSAKAIERIKAPTDFLWAPRGMFDQTPGLFPPPVVEAADAALDHLHARQVPDTNHYTIVTADHGARAVAEAILARMAG